jgi:hypothetical protein
MMGEKNLSDAVFSVISDDRRFWKKAKVDKRGGLTTAGANV